ncbi:peptidase M76 [Chytriomyces cf. hyalinus JEL632]|nr:peptidase M76 [Chytriomyces cf. hyalinus JEL632]
MPPQNAWLQEALESNDKVMHLMQSLANSGCAFTRKHITVGSCADTPNYAGGFHPLIGIRLCEENLRTREILEDTLTHELVHAYDWCTMNWLLSDLRHQACSEIRAGLISGDCRMAMELMRGRLPSKFGAKRIAECVKRRAVLSLLGNPSCSGREEASAIVDKVYSSCSKDTSPF